MIINNNLSALNAHRMILFTDNNMKKVLERLSSGMKINNASDDVAGLAISEKIRSQINGFSTGLKNSQDAISLVQTAEGGLNEIHSMLQRMRELSVYAANDTLTQIDREMIQEEIQKLKEGINNIAISTNFNQIKVLSPSSVTYGSGISYGYADIVFVIDITGSMGGIINTVSSNILNLVNKLSSSNVSDVRFGVLTYYDSSINKANFSTGKWTKNSDEISNYLNNLVLNGGTENTIAAIIEAVNYYDFRPNDVGKQNRFIIFVTDEPGDDNYNIPILKNMLQTNQIQLFGIFNTSFPELSGLVSDLNGEAINILNPNWNEDMVEFIGGRIGSSAGEVKSEEYLKVLTIQTGANEGDNMLISTVDARTVSLGIDDVIVTTVENAGRSITKLDIAIERVSQMRAYFGTLQNRLEHTIANLGIAAENLTAAESRIRDADMAKEMMAFTKQQILMQSGMSMLAQANGLPQNVLQLLRG